MTDKTTTSYDAFTTLSNNQGATAAAVDIITKAATASDQGTNKVNFIEKVIHNDLIEKLRDKIKEAAEG